MEHPAVGSVGVVGIADAMHGEDVCAYVVLRDGAVRPPAEELIRFARQRVGYKAPTQIVFIDTMPLSPSGKVDRTTLKIAAAERRGATAVGV